MRVLQSVFGLVFFAILLSGCALFEDDDPDPRDDAPEPATFQEDEYIIERGEAKISDVHSFTGDYLVIPETIDGYPVTEILEDAFAGYGQITQVTIPDSVAVIHSRAFKDIFTLKEVVLFRDAEQGITELESAWHHSSAPFEGTHEELRIYVPEDSVEAYRSDSDWILYRERIFSLDDYGNVYALIFDAMGGSPVDIRFYVAGEEIQEPKYPEKTGHTFMGWYETEDFDKPFEFDTMPNDNKTLYARWRTIEYDEFEYIRNWDTDYATITEKEDGVFLLYYFTVWCPACEDIKEDVLTFAEDSPRGYNTYLIDMNNIRGEWPFEPSGGGIPRMFVIEEGELVDEAVGSIEILALLNEIRSGDYAP